MRSFSHPAADVQICKKPHKSSIFLHLTVQPVTSILPSPHDLCLITDHIDLDKSEIPLGNIRSRRTGNCISIEQLAGNKCETEDDSEHFRCAHLLCDGPADTDRNTDVEDRLTDEPQEMVKSCPELAQLDKRMTALENIQGVDDISETEDKTSGDDGREERSKDLREDRCDPLQRILIPLRVKSL